MTTSLYPIILISESLSFRCHSSEISIHEKKPITRTKLPIGIQDFESIRRGGYVYVDKTQYIWDLVENGKPYFLSRPRRFGKSLLVSTMEAYFKGEKELFEGLDISELEETRGENAWTEYPVISFYLSGGQYGTREGLENVLKNVLDQTAAHYNITAGDGYKGEDSSVLFRGLIKALYDKTGRQVAVLVDEYDKPLLETMISDPEQERRNREFYKGFFSVLKDQDRHLKFVFFTGVTKFSQVSVFSDLNQPKDISLMDEYAEICGITEKELREYFRERIRNMSEAQNQTEEDCLSELARTYDGYHFSKNAEGVYNPFSLLNALADRDFGHYWFETGTPTFLIRKLEASSFCPEQFVDGVESTEAELKDYRPENKNPIPLFYQSGYLTICGYDREFRMYSLRFPNEEVRYGFLNSLVPYVLGERDAENPWSARSIVLALRKGDVDTVRKQLYSLFASVPYPEISIAGDYPDKDISGATDLMETGEQSGPGEAVHYKSYWRNQIYLIFALLGQYVSCETHTSRGRCDCTVQTADYVYLFEFKVDRSADEALRQIEEKDYAGRFAADTRKILRIGVNFSSTERNISEWKVQ